jgi:hypothetical protein
VASLDQPLPAEWSVRDGLEAYLAENGFTKEGYDSKWTEASLFGVGFKVPNTKAHRRAIMRHDLHHVATGFGTDLRGEAEISVWETAKGLSGVGLYVRAIVWSIVLTGWTFAPIRMLRAFRGARGRGSLFQVDDYESLLDLRIGELRARLELPRDGLAGARALQSEAPRPVGWSTATAS